jgi:hypothetical protein
MVSVGSFPRGGGPKTTQTKLFFMFFIVWFKYILPHTFILAYMGRIIFVLHFNPYFVTGVIALGGGAPLK